MLEKKLKSHELKSMRNNELDNRFQVAEEKRKAFESERERRLNDEKEKARIK